MRPFLAPLLVVLFVSVLAAFSLPAGHWQLVAHDIALDPAVLTRTTAVLPSNVGLPAPLADGTGLRERVSLAGWLPLAAVAAAPPPRLPAPPAPPASPQAEEVYEGTECGEYSSCRGAATAAGTSVAAASPGGCSPFLSPRQPPGPLACRNSSAGITDCMLFTRGRWRLTSASPAPAPPPLPTCTEGRDCYDGAAMAGNFSADMTRWVLPPGAESAPTPTVFTRHQALTCLAGRRVHFIGDSMARQVFNRAIAWFRGDDVIIEHYYHSNAWYVMNASHDALQVQHPGWYPPPRDRSESAPAPPGAPMPTGPSLDFFYEWYPWPNVRPSQLFESVSKPDVLVYIPPRMNRGDDGALILEATRRFLKAGHPTVATGKRTVATPGPWRRSRQAVLVTSPTGGSSGNGDMTTAYDVVSNPPLADIEALLADPVRVAACPVISYAALSSSGNATVNGTANGTVNGTVRDTGRDAARDAVGAPITGGQAASECDAWPQDAHRHKRNSRWRAARSALAGLGLSHGLSHGLDAAAAAIAADAAAESESLGVSYASSPSLGPRSGLAIVDWAGTVAASGARAPYLRMAQDGVHFQCGWNRMLVPPGDGLGGDHRTPPAALCYKAPPGGDCRDLANAAAAHALLSVLCAVRTPQ